MGFEVLIDGCWDLFLTGSIQSVSTKDRSPLFIDIGANLSLISNQMSYYFEQIIALEPKLSLWDYGLDSKSESVILKMPECNLGGAFGKSSCNRLTSEEIINNQRGRIDITKSFDISIKSASDFFQSITDLCNNIHNRIVIKVDVEGIEEPIIQPKHHMKWLDPLERENLENATELCFWNANFPHQDALKLCK